MTDADALDAHQDDFSQDYSNDAATFGDRIVVARQAMGLSESQLSRRLGIKVQTLRNWENDRAEPRANKLQMLAGMLNVSIIWLMSGEGPGVPEIKTGPSADEITDLLDEVRELRSLQTDLANRTKRLERRMLALVR